MNILLLGSGGREHALAWKLEKSPLCDQLYICPGNAGTSLHGYNIEIPLTSHHMIGAFCIAEKIEMLIIGPEQPLVDGLRDFFEENEELKNIMVLGPGAEGAKLEGSKDFAKEFMQEFDIPTAAYRTFDKTTLDEGITFIKNKNGPFVLKADGLAAGKGVLILDVVDEACLELKNMLGGKFGEASQKVVIEEFLQGIEFSVFVLTNGSEYKVLPVAKDYKRIGEGDTGLNTGGMGAVSHPPFVDDVMMKKVEERIIIPTINGLKNRNIPYTGFIFLGLISVGNEPFVIEYNCRLGDPETQVVIPRIKSDLVEMFIATHNGELNQYKLRIDERTCTSIILASGGYPGTYEKGKKIAMMDIPESTLVFHAGTIRAKDGLYTNGGRVMAISSFGEDVESAVSLSLKQAEKISFENKYFRKDIGFDL